ncbi:ubiquitin-binding domain-containing [Lecanosticta acicola]|uniref:Ubiquitin-binding domain-containing n=1 Tax=Lecanosticta acicola TaxID=111012 RepID=A0AAI8YWF5_9PEZI|nr:ubiquitin-binding domain-containing [Lecanosticta acicola]
MGCCTSTPNNANNAEAARIPSNGNRPANLSSFSPSSFSPNATGDHHHPQSEIPNQHIRPPSPLAKSPKDWSTVQPPWTRSHLEQQREIFFETRVQGNEEVWGAIRLIAESLRRGDLQEAQGIIDAARLTIPSGKIAKGRSTKTRGADGHRIRGGIFDESGRKYEVPDWVLTDPADIIEDGGGVGDAGEKEIGEDEEEEDGTSDTASSRPGSRMQSAKKPQKGKGKMEDLGDQITLRVRLSDQGTDTLLSVGTKQPVRAVLDQLREKAGATKVKLVYMGRQLEVEKTLEGQGWTEGRTVQAFVLSRD